MSAEVPALPEIPTDVQFAFKVTQQNGFFFQCDEGLGKKGYMLLGFLMHKKDKEQGWRKDVDESAENLVWQAHFGKDLVVVDQWLGRCFFMVHWSLYDRIPEVINYALHTRGLRLMLANGMEIHYNPEDTFVAEEVEGKFIELMKGWMRPDDPGYFDCITRSLGDRPFCVYNWQTAAGQDFCQELRRTYPHRIEAKEDTYNPYNFAMVKEATQKHRLFQYGRTWWWGPRIDVPVSIPTPMNEDTPMCMLCEERPSNTLVLPCEHSVVCLECSIKLKNTPDAHQCIRCRRPITSVLNE